MILSTGMDTTPGGKDESQVPIAMRLNAEVDLGERVQLLISNITFTIYKYISQVCFLDEFCNCTEIPITLL